MINQLGIKLFSGNRVFNNTITLDDDNYFFIYNSDVLENNLDSNNNFFQTKEITNFLYNYLNSDKIKSNIIDKNPFNDRYNTNNDLFVHVRLDDVEEMDTHNNFEYYDNIIKKYSFDTGYITSDNLNSSICYNLIKKYSLKIIDLNEEETIMFGSTCNNIILSGGTFSWLIGFLAFYSKNINYPINIKKWYGDIFIYNNWIGN
jgi:hypothetical protein